MAYRLLSNSIIQFDRKVSGANQMKRQAEQTKSVWMATAAVPKQPVLPKDLKVDVCVVGAGIAGISTAYALSKAGKKVAVLDSRHIAAGQTQRTTAHLSNAHDNFYSEVEKVHGVEGIRIAAESHTRAIDRIEEIVQTEGIDCDFSRLPGYLFCPPGQKTDILDTELESATRAGLTGLEIVGRAPLTSFDTGRCLRYPRQAQFHPLKYIAHLTESIQKMGGEIYGGTQIQKVTGGSTPSVETSNGPAVSADAIVVATNTPVNDLYAMHTKMAPYLTYVIAARIPHRSITRGLYWDTEEYYHYVRLQSFSASEDLIIIGGEDHKAGQADDQTDRHERLETWGRERFPMMGKIEYRWSGMVMETTDGGAFIGKNPGDQENIFIATGDSGMGMTHGTIAGILLTDLILGREHPWVKFYDPARKPVSGMAWRNFVSENWNVGKEYLVDWLSGGDRSSADELQPDEGAVLRRGLSKIAVYRDRNGKTHECSSVCPHMGCIVHWNNLEKVWDCPCHGSRFDAYGRVVNGPAISDLAPVEKEVQKSE